MSQNPRILLGPLPDARGLLPNIRTPGNFVGSEYLKVFTDGEFDSKYYDIPFQFSPDGITNLFKSLPAGWYPDVLIWCDSTYHPIPLDILSCPVPTGVIPLELNLHCYQTLDTVSLFDYILTHHRFLSVFQKSGHSNCQFWPAYSFDRSQHFFETQERIYDVTFIGNISSATLYPRRARLLRELFNLHPEYHILIADGIRGAEYRKILNQSKIIVNMTAHGEMNLRAYEAPSCGALLFIEEDNFEIRQFLKPSEECVCYTDDNFLEQLSYYLSHPDKLALIAQAGYQRIQTFDLTAQFQMLFDCVENIKHAAQKSGRRANKLSSQELMFLHCNQLRSCRMDSAQQLAQSYYQSSDIQTWRYQHKESIIALWEAGFKQEQLLNLVEATKLYGQALQRLQDQRLWEPEYKQLYNSSQLLLIAPYLISQLPGLYYTWQGLAYKIPAQDRSDACRNLFGSLLCHALGQLSMNQQNLESAISYFQKALLQRPEQTDSQLALGHAFLQLGHLNEAFDCYNKALNQNPFIPSFWKHLSQLSFCVLFEQKFDFSLMISLLKTGTQLAKIVPSYGHLLDDLNESLLLANICRHLSSTEDIPGLITELETSIARQPSVGFYRKLFSLIQIASHGRQDLHEFTHIWKITAHNHPDEIPSLPIDCGFEATHQEFLANLILTRPTIDATGSYQFGLYAPKYRQTLKMSIDQWPFVIPTPKVYQAQELQDGFGLNPAYSEILLVVNEIDFLLSREFYELLHQVFRLLPEHQIIIWKPFSEFMDEELARLEITLASHFSTEQQEKLIFLLQELSPAESLGLLLKMDFCLLAPGAEFQWYLEAGLYIGKTVYYLYKESHLLGMRGDPDADLSSLGLDVTQLDLSNMLSNENQQKMSLIQTKLVHYYQQKAPEKWLSSLWKIRINLFQASLLK